MSDEKKGASTAQTVRIIEDFLLNAPSGEYEQVMLALKQVVEDSGVISEAITNTIEKWYLAECSPVQFDGHVSIICEEAKLPNGQFIDPVTNTPFSFDFSTMKVVPRTVEAEPEQEQEQEASPEDEAQEKPAEPVKKQVEEVAIESTPLRKALQEALEKAAPTFLNNGHAGVYDSKGGQDIVLRASTVSLPNFRSGSLILKFHLKDLNIEGSIAFNSHFYENGSTMGKQTSQFKKAVKGGTDEEIANNVVAAIKEFVEKWSSHMAIGFENLTTEGLNKLRRRLPVTKTTVNWRHEIVGAAAMGIKK